MYIFFILLTFLNLLFIVGQINAADSNAAPYDYSPFCGNGSSTTCISTAFGEITITDPSKFVSTLITFGTGIAGGIAFLLILLGGLQLMTSSGNPEKLTAGKELISSAIIGLVLILSSIFLLKLIGVDILGIPDFK